MRILTSLKAKVFAFFGLLFVVYMGSNIYNFSLIQVIDNAAIKQKLFLSTLIAAVIISIGCVIFIVIVYKSVFKPIDVLNKATNRMAGGDLTEELKVGNQDEIGTLMINFNIMTQNLKSILHNMIESVEQVAAFSQQLSASAEENQSTSEQISEIARNIAKNAESQLEAARESEALMKKMSEYNEQIVLQSDQISDASKATTEEAQKGNESMEDVFQQIHTIRDSVHNSAAVIQSLGQRSKEIGAILNLITDIANQTSILALNASIEASRAGEHGRGFAVVANEVKNLAEQSVDAVNKISQIVKEIQNATEKAVDMSGEGIEKVETGMKSVELTREVFHNILQATGKTARQIGELTALSQEMLESNHRVMASITSVTQTAQDTFNFTVQVAESAEQQSYAIEEVSRASDELSTMAQDLQDKAGKFKV